MNKYYRKVNPLLLKKFNRFKADHPLITLRLDGHPWEYLDAGTPSAQPLLWLPGALGTADSSWQSLSLLNLDKFHLLCPSYPPDEDTMTSLADGLASLLDTLAIESTQLVGGAYGSMLAQVFTHRHPQRVSRLVLTHAYPPVHSRIKSATPSIRLISTLPMIMARRMLRLTMTGTLPPNPSPELLLIAAQIRETVDKRLTRSSALNIYYRMVDFDEQSFTPTDLADWPGKVLLLQEEDDPSTPEPLRQQLIDLYPGAQLHLFKGRGPTASILDPRETIPVIEAFLAEPG